MRGHSCFSGWRSTMEGPVGSVEEHPRSVLRLDEQGLMQIVPSLHDRANPGQL